MAGRDTPRWRLIGAITLAVGLLHGAALCWLASAWQEPTVLRPLATPLFTRTLTVAAAPPPGARARAKPAPSPPAPPAPPLSPDAAPPAPVPAAEPVAPPAPAAQPAPDTSANVEPLPGDSWPANTRLSYTLTGNFRGALHGSAQVLWTRQGERYEVRLSLGLGWLKYLSMTSQGVIGATQLNPDVFEEEVGLNRRHVAFTPQDIVYMNGSRQPRPEGVQDSVSQFVQLAHGFAQAPEALAVGQSVSVWLARPEGADAWTYDVVDLEALSTPHHGAVDALHLKPRPLAHPRGPITAEMWFAPTLQYLPVRIRINLNEQTWVDLLVDTIEQSDLPNPP